MLAKGRTLWRTENARTGAGFDLTPLIDCVFLLIAFFLIAGKFKRPEPKLHAYLPEYLYDPGARPAYYMSIFAMHGDDGRLVWEVNQKKVESRADLVKEVRRINAHALYNGYAVVLPYIDAFPDVEFQWVVASIDEIGRAHV